MKVVILAGGFGTRISEYTKTIPKPMILINKVPILVHLINHFKYFVSLIKTIKNNSLILTIFYTKVNF